MKDSADDRKHGRRDGESPKRPNFEAVDEFVREPQEHRIHEKRNDHEQKSEAQKGGDKKDRSKDEGEQPAQEETEHAEHDRDDQCGR